MRRSTSFFGTRMYLPMRTCAMRPVRIYWYTLRTSTSRNAATSSKNRNRLVKGGLGTAWNASAFCACGLSCRLVVLLSPLFVHKQLLIM
jgi:hypothetical protein